MSLNSSNTNPFYLDEDLEVYIQYESETYPLDEVTDYKSLCEKIEANLDGVKAQDLKITYKTTSGVVVTVKNDSTFNAAKKKMKTELIFTCTLNSLPVKQAPIASTSQKLSQGLPTEQLVSLLPPLNSQLLSNSNPNCTFETQQPPVTPQQLPGIQSFPNLSSTSSTFDRQNLYGQNLTYPNTQPNYNVVRHAPTLESYPLISSYPSNFPQQVAESYPQLTVQGQDAAKCACGQYISVSQRKSGICSNQGCMLQANQTNTLLWSCQNQSPACGNYCWMCVQTKLKYSQVLQFQNLQQKVQMSIIRKNQEIHCKQPAYNPAPYVTIPDQNVLNTPPLNLNTIQIPYVEKPQQIQNLQNVEQRNINLPNEQQILPQKFQKQAKTEKQVVEPQIQLIEEIPIPDFPSILGLNQNDFEKLEHEVVEFYKDLDPQQEGKFINYLCECEDYKLEEKRDELLKFCQKYNPKQPLIQQPILPNIKAYSTKKKIIDFIVKNENMPIGFKLKEDFEGLKSDQLSQFKDCNKNFNGITFKKDELFDEELKLVSQLFIENKSKEEIQQITLIHIDLVQSLCNSNEMKLKKETELVDSIHKRSSCQTNDEVIKLIVKDDEELVKVLFQIYKDNKDEYLQITQKLIDKSFATNFASSQELKSQIDIYEEQINPPIPNEPRILGLDKNNLDILKREIIRQIEYAQTIEDEFIEDLCKQFELQEVRAELKEFCQKFTQDQSQPHYPILPKIAAYETKQRIIDLIVNNKMMPSNYILTKSFEGLSTDQIDLFKQCYQNFKAIFFQDSDLLEEDRKVVLQHQIEKKSNEEISKITLIHVDLVKYLCDQKRIELKQEIELLGLIRKHSKHQTDDDVISLIVKDDNELIKVLVSIYKVNKADYHHITKQLKDKNYAINFEQSQLQKLIKLAALPNLGQSTDNQKEVQLLLNHFINTDLVVFLMVLRQFTDTVDDKVLDRIILKKQHKNFCTAIVQQQLILKLNQDKKTEVIESKKFEDSREQEMIQNLQQQIEQYLDFQKQRQKNEKPVDEQQIQSDFQHEDLNKLEMSKNEELVNSIKAVCNITKTNIRVHSKSELTKYIIYEPEGKNAEDTLILVRDDLKKDFYVMIEYQDEKKIIDSNGLSELKKKYPFLIQIIPQWLDIFIKLDSFRMFLTDSEINPKRMLENIAEAHQEVLQVGDEACKKKLYDAAVKFNLDSQLMQDWFSFQIQDIKMTDFCNFMMSKGTRQKPNWKIAQADQIQQYFPMGGYEQKLQDFNRVQTYQDPDDRKRKINELKSQPEELTSFIINTFFGAILRKDELSLIQSEIEQIIQNSNISLRFLVSYLLQSADMNLRARLSYYLCQNKSVPLIMNCQRKFRNSNITIYNQELVFSISDVEGVGVFALGVEETARNPCGKSEISNLIVTPKFDNKSFDVQDSNVFSNGQIDVFFEKCYQQKKGWAFMDGQGEISDQSLLSVLHLTNIVLIHFFQKDSNDETRVANLANTIKLIKDIDASIQVCLILRDCTETKDIKKSEYPVWLPCKEKVDKLIELINISKENRLVQKSILINKILFYFNDTVEKIKTQKNGKFTKKNFIEGFCKFDSQNKEKYQRISDILQLSNQFIQEVSILKENVFSQQGLPSLKIKDQIREIILKLRSFQYVNDEDEQTAKQRAAELNSQLKKFTDQLKNLEVNSVMQHFWKIVNHEDAVLIKIEVQKGLNKFTTENISETYRQKKEFMNQNGKNAQLQKDGGLQSKEEIQNANDQYKEKMKQFEDEIFKRSLSYEYFWRSLICLMVDSKQCNYWKDDHNNYQFKEAVKKQMLDGDTFELIDGRNLEMKADIIRQIVGYDIECTKCIVACVIGPQSTGKSTLMNFCFGTQFLASTGRCTQGIYFTLQKIPPEMKNGSDVDFLIILDTEGLNSPERAEGDRPDSEYDRKIVLFTLLCSDFLIINSSGDMSLQMKELIKICAVRYDELRLHAKAPKILYTFVKNSDNNPIKFKEQIQSLRSDVIESSDESTIQQTADELMSVHDDLVKVLGSAFDQKLIEKDSEKGILYSTYINVCAPLFGVHASDVWKQVQNFIQSGQHQFRQIGAWLQQAGDFWSLIDTCGANITQFANVLQMKNDRKIKQYISQLWQLYINTQITSKDNQKAIEKCRDLYDKFRDGENIEPWKIEFFKENDLEKEKDFQKFILDKFSVWKLEHSQRTITVGAELKHLSDLQIKMDILKNDYKLLIENKFKEIQLTQIHTSAISEFGRKARNLCEAIKKMPEQDQDLKIREEFEKCWSKLETEISHNSQIERMRKTNAEYLCRTFKSVNRIMPDFTPAQSEFSTILAASNSDDMYPNSTLPKMLVELLVDHISINAFKDENNNSQLDTKAQFKFDQSMLGGLVENPKQRIFGQSSDAVKEKYLPLQRLLKVDYTYYIINDFEGSLHKSSIFKLIETYLTKKKDKIYNEVVSDLYGKKSKQQFKQQIDDRAEIENNIFAIFYELGQAGFCLQKEDLWHGTIMKQTKPLDEFDIGKLLEDQKMYDNNQKKQLWLNSIKQNIRWQQKHKRIISPRVQSLLSYDEVLIKNQLHPNIKFEEHKEVNERIKTAKHVMPVPNLSYYFTEDNLNGKIDVRKFLKEKNMEKSYENYYECLVRPKEYKMSESFKWTYLSELANAVVDWRKIVLDIDELVSQQTDFKKKKTQSHQQKVNMKFDLQHVLESSTINIEQAENIQTSILQPIKIYLDYEVRQKLSLFVNPKLSGVITWVACVIIWYKLQKNIITIFKEEIENIKKQKENEFKRFYEIARGQTTATTAQFADEIFNHAFKKFNDNCLKETNQEIFKHFESQLINEKFNTETIYKQMDEIYIGQVNPSQYQKSIGYALNPVKEFTTFVNKLKDDLLVEWQKKEAKKYQQRVLSNLQTLHERLHQIQQTMKSYEELKDDSVNFFDVMKDGKKIEDEDEKEEIISKMSPILVNTLRKVLDGSYTVGQQLLSMTVNGVFTEYSFTVKQRDLAKKIQGSPYNDLQTLAFDKTKPQEFLNEFFERLDLCQENLHFGVCTDLRFFVGQLIDLLDQKVSEIKGINFDCIKTKAQDDLIHSYVTKAIGCKEVCKFCNRKCELAPHQEEIQDHSCNNRGHSLRVFGGGTFVTSYGEMQPSLTTCDEIKHDTKIRIVIKGGTEVQLWYDIHKNRNINWTTEYKKYVNNTSNINPDWSQMQQKLQKFWEIHGNQFCTEMKYKFIDYNSASQIDKKEILPDSALVIICLDNSGSMFNTDRDFDKAVQAGKELEQYLKKTYQNSDRVQIQLWFNDCPGVNCVYKGQLSSTIPENLWSGRGCKNLEVYSCGQFEGAVRILNQEVNNLLASTNYDRVYWFVFTDGGNTYPREELNVLQQTLSNNRKRWDYNGKTKLRPTIITNQLKVQSLVQMKLKIDQMMQDIWQLENACTLKQDVKTEKLGETMIEQFTFE